MGFDLESMRLEEKFALLFGIMLGDGCLSHYFGKKRDREFFTVSITGSYHDDEEFYNNVLVPLLEFFSDKNIKVKERPKRGSREIICYDKSLFKKIKNFGFPVGKKGSDLSIPEIFYEKELLSYIVSGVFATDGSLVLTKNPNKYYPRLELHCISGDMASQIHKYLNNLGMNGHIYKYKLSGKDNKWNYVHRRYRFQFNGRKNLNLFKELIGFANFKHEKRFHNFVEYSKEYDNKIKGEPPKKQNRLRKELNSYFLNKISE
ncbi:MAG: LAGLIDADG family homing endonuclease [Candidatus Woesearchaeota archaeon]